MRASLLTKVGMYLRDRGQQSLQVTGAWLSGTTDRLLNRSYEAALRIQSLEADHFDGDRISARSPAAVRYSSSVLAYFQTELERELGIVRRNFSIFKASNRFLAAPPPPSSDPPREQNGVVQYQPSHDEHAAQVLAKLQFIDAVLDRYPTEAMTAQRSNPNPNGASRAVVPVRPGQERSLSNMAMMGDERRFRPDENPDSIQSVSDRMGVLPRSILGTVDRITRELSPEAEQNVVQEFRSSKKETILALRFLLLLMLIPLLSQQLTKNFVVGPIVNYFRQGEMVDIFINTEMEEEAFAELKLFKENLEFKTLIQKAPKLSEEDLEERVKEKASELARDYQIQSSNAIKNVFADIFGVITFAIMLTHNKRGIGVFQSFSSKIVYGLSDSAKAFILILLTDVFVGFHSPHGWEVILEGVCRHLGLPANRDFIFIFIATFPVILDTIFKYWIFRYLNRISPSAVATYKNMNE